MGEKKIIRAETMGFCMGVRRAIELTEKTLQSSTPRPVYTLGPLIHNKQVLKKLRDQGVIEADDPKEIDHGTVIIRTHGVTPGVLQELKHKSVTIIDATCTRVIASMRNAENYSKKGYHVILAGDSEHGEIRAIAGYADPYSVIGTGDDFTALPILKKSVIIGQTTLREADYTDICRILQDKLPQLQIINSICPATEQRQKALRELLVKVEAVVVIGGKNSANTKRLYETAKQELETTWHVETADDLPEEIGKFRVVGITAGASTPDWIIESIEKRIRALW